MRTEREEEFWKRTPRGRFKTAPFVSSFVTPDSTQVTVRDVVFGGPAFVVIAGPCAIESEIQISQIARDVRRAGATMLRGGAFKPRTSPHTFQGLGLPALHWLQTIRSEMPVVSEVMDPRLIDDVVGLVDMLQVGSRNMANFPLLSDLGRIQKPVLLKRGFGATVEEFVHAAEYIVKGVNDQVVLCERGVRTFEPGVRDMLDLAAVRILKRETHLPVIVDPSHAAGDWDLVAPLARAAVAAGADGLMIEVHPDPSMSMSDGPQALTIPQFENLMCDIRAIAGVFGRPMDD